MVGVLELTEGRGRPEAGRCSLLGLGLLRVRVPVTDKLSGGRLVRRLEKGARLLTRAGVRRVLTAADFPHWDLLARHGLEPVDPAPLCQALAAPLTLEAMARRGVDPERGTVSLWAPRPSSALLRAAEELCPRVRLLTVDVPGEEEALAGWLWREFGAAALRPEAAPPADAAVWFADGGGRGAAVLRLYGPAPDLAGLTLAPPRDVAEAGLDPVPAMALLWEAGRLDRQKIAISSTSQT